MKRIIILSFIAVFLLFGINITLADTTPTTYTNCIDGKCTVEIYTGIKFTLEEGKWIDVKDAKSLKGSGIECIVTLDGENHAECLDWNYTTVTLKLKKDKNAGDTPLKLYEIDSEKTKDGKKEYKIKSEKILGFADTNDTRVETVPLKVGQILHFGENSTTIELKNYPSDSIGDMNIYSVTDNTGTQAKWNISSIPAGQIINNAMVCYWMFEKYGTFDTDINISRVVDQTWNVGAVSAAYVNAQVTDTMSEVTTNSTADDSWWCFNITTLIAVDYNAGNKNASIRFTDPDKIVLAISGVSASGENKLGQYSGGAGPYGKLDTADGGGGGPGNEPVLTITYSTPPVNNPPSWGSNYTQYPSFINYSATRTYGFEVKWVDDNDATGFYFAYFENNFTGTLTNYTASKFGSVSYYNFSSIPTGNHLIRFYVNDSENAWNKTDQWIYSVNRAGTSCRVVYSVNPVPWGSNTQECYYGSADGVSAALPFTGWYNITIETETDTPYCHTIQFIASWIGVVNSTINTTTAHQNYTACVNTTWLTVGPKTTACSVGISSNPATFGDIIRITGNVMSGATNLTASSASKAHLYLDGSAMSETALSLVYDTSLKPPNTYNISLIWPGNLTYGPCFDSELFILQAQVISSTTTTWTTDPLDFIGGSVLRSEWWAVDWFWIILIAVICASVFIFWWRVRIK